MTPRSDTEKLTDCMVTLKTDYGTIKSAQYLFNSKLHHSLSRGMQMSRMEFLIFVFTIIFRMHVFSGSD